MKNLMKICAFVMILFLIACTEQPAEEPKIEKETQNIIEVVSEVEVDNQSEEQLPLDERIMIEMDKDINSIENIFQGQLDNRELGFATFSPHEESLYEQTNYKLESSIQSELLEYLKSIKVEVVEREFYKREYGFDFWIIRPRYGNYLTGSIAVDLETKTMMIAVDTVLPNLYKVHTNEEEVFKKLEYYFGQSEKVETD